MKKYLAFAIPFLLIVCQPAIAQQSQRNAPTRIQGNTNVTAVTNNMNAVAIGEGNVAKNRVGVVQGDKKGNTNIAVAAGNVSTVVIGRNKKACTNIGGIVSDECK